MIESVIVATAALKERISIDEAFNKYQPTFNEIAHECQPDEVSILLNGTSRQTGHPFDESEGSRRYAAYQDLLKTTIQRQVEKGQYDIIVNCDGQDILSVHLTICSLLSQRGVANRPILDLSRTIVGLGGLSESGKSVSAEYLRTKHRAMRLKLSYLLTIAERTNGYRDIYAESPETIVEALLFELGELSNVHHFIKMFTIESLHRYDTTKELKKYLGDAFHIVYLDCPESVRTSRADANDDIDSRDALKRQRGADRIKTIADTVIDNTSSHFHLRRRLDEITLPRADIRHVTACLPINDTQVDEYIARLQASLLSELGETLCLFTVVGSAAVGEALRPWSDIDILIVVKTFESARIKAAISRVACPFSKLGLTTILHSNLLALEVEGRILSIMRDIRSGSLQIRYIAEGVTLPEVDLEEVRTADETFLPHVFHLLSRSLLFQDNDSYPIYKLIVLIAKLILRCDNVDTSSFTRTTIEFNRRYRSTGAPTIPGVDEIRAERVSATDVRRCGEELIQWYGCLRTTSRIEPTQRNWTVPSTSFNA
jgi:hypothetical protein